MPSSRFAALWVAATAAFMVGMSVDPPYSGQLWLQHIPTVAILLGMSWLAWRGCGSRVAITCIHLFLWLHIIGARWIYSYVPYDAWSETLLGLSISEHFGWTRNHYDRLVHLASGILLAPPAFEWLRYRRVAVADAAWLAVCLVLAMGAAYEVFEWTLAVVLAPEDAESYNGQQGDPWDPQKDMALAWLGATFSSVVLFLANRHGPDDRLARRLS